MSYVTHSGRKARSTVSILQFPSNNRLSIRKNVVFIQQWIKFAKWWLYVNRRNVVICIRLSIITWFVTNFAPSSLKSENSLFFISWWDEKNKSCVFYIFFLFYFFFSLLTPNRHINKTQSLLAYYYHYYYLLFALCDLLPFPT